MIPSQLKYKMTQKNTKNYTLTTFIKPVCIARAILPSITKTSETLEMGTKPHKG